MKQVYADHAAATPVDDRVVSAATNAAKLFGNPSSIHAYGQKAAAVLQNARQGVAEFLRATASEIYFTASGTESNNLAILGIARANKAIGDHIITSTIEHPSVLGACRSLERDGFEVTYLPVTSDGRIEVEKLATAIRPTTVLVSIHLANSEVGVVQDIAALAAITHKHNAVFHTDACQASSLILLDARALGVDALTFNGSKLYGPRGVAALYVRDGVSIFPLVYGGGQEQSLRSGTENLPAIVGLAEACRIATDERAVDNKRLAALRDELQDRLEKNGCQVNCALATRLPNHLSVTLQTEQTDVVSALDSMGVSVSSGSACSSRTQSESHVLTALGLTSEQINKTVRITIGRTTTAQDCDQIFSSISKIVSSLA